MGSMDSWMYDKQVQVSVCLTGQFALLMLVEALELAEIHVFSFNTDGITLKLHKHKVNEFEKICKEWEVKTNFILERVDYKKIFYSTVNDYMAITTEGKVKTKGDFISDFELWKNKSNRVVALALQEYFTKGTKPEDFINNHKNIFDYCIMARASGQLYLEMQRVVKKGELNQNWKQEIENEWFECLKGYWAKKEWLEQGIDYYKSCLTYEEMVEVVKYLPSKVETRQLKKLVRYYLSNNSDWQLYKRGIGSTGKSANISMNAANELGEIYIQYYNTHVEKTFEDYNVDLNQYIYKAYKMIAKIEKNKKDKQFLDSLKQTPQLTLF